MPCDPRPIYYVYILFDECAVPRYVGKGKGRRWLAHDDGNDPNNWLKNVFVKRTIRAIGSVPKIKVRENLTEEDAFKTESAIIKAIGRHPNGPLTNLTDKRNGATSESIKAWHASRTPEERSVTLKKVCAAMTPEARSERARKNGGSVGKEVMVERMRQMHAKQSPEERRRIATMAGIASAAATSIEQKRERTAKSHLSYMTNTTHEQRSEMFKKSGIGKLTKEQLSENGKRGAATANGNRTSEQRSLLSSKASLARFSKMTHEERKALAKKASIASRIVLDKRTPEQKSATARKVWKTRRELGKTSTVAKGSKWINNGTQRVRLQEGKPLPEGWVYGYTLNTEPSC